MSCENCSNFFNDSKHSTPFVRGVAAKVPLAPLGKVTAFSVVYGVLFLASIIGELYNSINSRARNPPVINEREIKLRI